MGIEICGVGGYNQVGKNMTAINVDGDVVLLDMGLYLEEYIKYQGETNDGTLSTSRLLDVGALPDISKIKEWHKKVKAIIPSHAHLDHIGAIPFLGNMFNAPIIGTPFTIEVLKLILKKDELKINNKLKVLKSGKKIIISKNITVEFIHVTHSTPQTVMIAIHTKYGVILYTNDFKFDNNPTIGNKPNYNRLKELGKKRILALIADSTNAPEEGHTPSELDARNLLEETMLNITDKKKAVLVTTFSSHISRLKSIVEFGRKMKRRPIFIGRSLNRYSEAAKNVGLIDFSKKVEIVKYSSRIKQKFKKINRQIGNYLLVATGHQGEINATLSKMVDENLGYNFKRGDVVIFSCDIIPTPTSIENRKILEEKLNYLGVTIFKDVHSSGHASKEDIKDLIKMVKPKHIIPSHGDLRMRSALADFSSKMGYTLGKDIHFISNGGRLKLS